MKRVVLLPNNTDLNRGDQALVWESIRLIKDIYGDDTEVSLIRTGINEEDIARQSSQTMRKGYRLLSPILKHPGRFRIFQSRHEVNYHRIDIILIGLVALFDLFTSSLLLSRWKWINKLGGCFLSEDDKATVYALRESDYVYVKGGGFIHSYGKIADPYQMYYSLFLMLLAQRYDKSLFILPNSIGPLKNRWAKKIVEKVLRSATVVFVREALSFFCVKKEFGIDCIVTSDLGYYLENRSSLDVKRYMPETERQIVGVTLRPWRFLDSGNPEKSYRQYISSFAMFVSQLVEERFYVCLFVHTLGPSAHENDEIAVDDVLGVLPKGIQYVVKVKDEQLDCYDMMKLYGCCDYFIGTRFHSVIFAQNMNVPTISISYGGNKGKGIMEKLSLDQFNIPINEVTVETLSKVFMELKNKKEHYREQLLQHKSHLGKERESLLQQCKMVSI